MSLRTGGFKRGCNVLGENKQTQRKKQRVGNLDVVQPAAHDYVSTRRHRYASVNVSPAVASGALDATQQFVYTLDTNVKGKVENPVFVFDITCVADGIVAPVTYWFDWMEVRTKRGKVINRLDMDNLYHLQQADPRTEYHHKLSAQTRTGLGPVVGENVKAGVSKKFYLKLPHTVFANWPELIPGFEEDLEVYFQPRGDITARVLNDLGGVTLNSLSLVIDSSALRDLPNLRMLKDTFLTTAYKHNYLDTIRIRNTGQELTRGVTKQFDLEQVRGFCAGLIIGIREDTKVDGGGVFKYNNIGPKGTIDIVDSQSNSHLTQGQPVPYEYIKNFWNPQFFVNERYAKESNLIFIPFAKCGHEMLEGVINGGLQMDGHNFYVDIKLDATAPVSEQHTLVVDGGNPTTDFHMSWRGEFTGKIAAAATDAAIEAAFNALSTVKEDGIVANITNTAATYVIDLNAVDGGAWENLDGHIPMIHTLGPITHSITEEYQGGSTLGGSSSTVDIWPLMYADVQTGREVSQGRIIGRRNLRDSAGFAL